MNVQCFPLGSYAANAYLLVADDSASAALIDPGADPNFLLAAIGSARAPLDLVLLTHAHPDHVSALAQVLAAHPEARVVLHPRDAAWLSSPQNAIPPDYPTPPPLPADRVLPLPPQGSPLPIPVAGTSCLPIHVPGHTPGGLLFHFPDAGLLFTGDTLFRDSVGRTDLPGGSSRDLLASLKAIAALPPALTIYPGHGDSSTLRRELDCNYFLQPFRSRQP